MRICPQPVKAKNIGCLDYDEDKGQCNRKIWHSDSYFKEGVDQVGMKHEFYCERIGAVLKDE